VTAIRAVTPEALMLGEIVEVSNRPGNRAVGQRDQATSWPAQPGCEATNTRHVSFRVRWRAAGSAVCTTDTHGARRRHRKPGSTRGSSAPGVLGVCIDIKRVRRLAPWPGPFSAVADALAEASGVVPVSGGTGLRRGTPAQPLLPLAGVVGMLLLALTFRRCALTPRGRRHGLATAVTLVPLGLLVPGCKCSSDEPEDEHDPTAIRDVPPDAIFYLGDHQGSPLVLTNADGAVVERLAYHPYGTLRHRAGTSVDPFTFVSNEFDTGSGLADFKARPYWAEAGVFLAPDPVAVFSVEEILPGEPEDDAAESWSGRGPSIAARSLAYQYAGADPVNFVDADGREPVTLGTVATAFGIGAAFGVASYVVTETILGDEVTAQGVAGAAVGGGISGASALGGVGAAAVGGAVGALADDWIAGRESTITGIGISASVNAALPVVGRYALKAGVGAGILRAPRPKGSTYFSSEGLNVRSGPRAHGRAVEASQSSWKALQSSVSGAVSNAYGRLFGDERVQNQQGN